jgi:hypothetical protein
MSSDTQIPEIMRDDDPGESPVMCSSDIVDQFRKKPSIQIGSWLIHDDYLRTME